MKSYLLAAAMLLLAALGLKAQVVTTDPSPLQMASKNVVIYFHANQGDKGLIDQPAGSPVYAHMGYILKGSTDWKGAPTWNKNEDKYKLSYVSPNLWKLEIGSIPQFFGIPESTEVAKLAFVFRDAKGERTGRAAGGGDIFVDVVPDGFVLSLVTDIDGNVVTEPGTQGTLTATTTQAATISISVNGKQIASQANTMKLAAKYTFTDTGNYNIVATATAGGETMTETLDIFMPEKSPQADYPGGTPRMGAVRQSDGSVLFCLAAPQKQNCMLIGSWSDYAPDANSVMSYQDKDGVRYFWTRVKDLDPDKWYMYYYFVDGSRRVGDPYARLVLDPQNDKYIPEKVFPGLPEYPVEKVANVSLAVYWENIDKYDWKVKDFKRPEKHNLFIYELLLRDFTGTEGKALGDGTVRGAISKIHYLKKLGVNAIELLPINEFNGNISWGYNPNFYFAVDKAYGTPKDYKDFIDACHANGIAVILDIVFNQTDWQHPWYQMYDVGQNPFFNASAPHAYSVLNDWNQGNPLVQQQFKDCLQYWLKEYKVDGFRFDLVKGLGDNDSYSNSGDAATNAYNASRVARMKSLHEAVEAVSPGAFFINENLAGAKEENEMAADGQLNWANVNHQAIQFAKGTQADSGLERFYAPLDSRAWGSTVSYAESHDEQRLAFEQKQNGATGIRGNVPNSMRRLGSMAAQMLLSPGSHMIWQFSELGNEQSTKSGGSNNTDPKIVNWALLDNPDRKGLYQSYRELIAVRTSNPDMFTQQAGFSDMCQANNWDGGRFLNITSGDRQILLVVNPSVTKTATLKAQFVKNRQDDYKVLSQSFNTTPVYDVAAGTVTLQANSYVVLGTQDMTGVDTPAADVEEPVVTGGEGCINIPAGARAEVYTIDGTRMGRTTDLAPGIYIVRTGARTAKVLVR